MRSYLRFGLLGSGTLLLALALGLAGSSVATAPRPVPAAAPQLALTTYSLPHDPNHPRKGPWGIAAGADGNLWFTETYAHQIGRITPAGTITEYPLPTANGYPRAITVGLHNDLWFIEEVSNQIGRITTAGAITEYPVHTAIDSLCDIALGADGNIWFTEINAHKVGRITPAGQVSEFTDPLEGGGPTRITAGPDGNLWFTEYNWSQVGRITPAGLVTAYSSVACGGGPCDIASGPDGNLWIAGSDYDGWAHVGRLTPAGVLTDYSFATEYWQPSGLTRGPDGKLWFLTWTANYRSSEIGRITPGGDILMVDLPAGPEITSTNDMTMGSDGNLWFTDFVGDSLHRLSDLGNLPTATPTPSPTATATPTASPTPVCPGAYFHDVCVGAWYYPWVTDLVNLGAISGYSCGGPGEPCEPQNRPYFRPYADITRGQLTKAAVVAFGIPVSDTEQIFADVPPDNAFYSYVNTAYLRGIVSGYDCGGPGEPCDPQDRPYFRPYIGITRGQAGKIITLARGWAILTPPVASFADVDAQQPFYSYVETIRAANTISGYDCGSPGEPCDAQHRPYFRPGNNITRAQAAKILDLARSQAPPTPTPGATDTATPTGTPEASATPTAEAPPPSATPTDTPVPDTVTPTSTPSLR